MPSSSVSLLGPLTVTIDETAVDVPGRGERALLSLLALDVGRLVSVQRLVESLWGEDLPADPTNALQLRVSKLRRSIGDLVVTEPAGYRLDLPAAAVDVHRFRELVARRRPREALALWRGPPLAEFAGLHWADVETTALQEERLHALSDRIDADLAAGRHRELVAELDRLVVEHPAREQLWAQLMLAQYRCDRQAAALSTFRRARDVLAGEFGLDPGPRLLELERAILRQDPAVAPPSLPAAGPPAPVGQLVGRSDELEKCRELLDRHRLVTVLGPGGVGKTRLALEVAQQAATGHEDGIVVVRLGELEDPGRLTAGLAAAIGVDQQAGDGDLDVLTRWFARRQCLLVLDGCEHLVAAVARLVGDLLAAAPRLTVLATSRVSLGLPGGADVPLPPLDPASAVELFLVRADEVAGGERSVEDRSAAAAIVDRVDRLPLAIELAAAWTRSLPAAAIAARLADDLALLDHGGGVRAGEQRTLGDVVAASLDLLAPPEAVLFRRLAVFAGGWSLEDAEVVCGGDGLDDRPVVALLARLVDQSLVVADGGRFRMLRPLATVAAAQLADAEEDAEARCREAHADHFLTIAQGAEQGLRGPEQAAWLRRLHDSAANIAAALSWARQPRRTEPDELLLATAGLGWFWFLGRHGDGRRELAAALEAASSADEPPSPSALGRALQAQSIVLRPGGCLVHPDELADDLAVASHDLLADAGDEMRALLSSVMCEVRAVGGDEVDAAVGRLAAAATRFRDQGEEWSAALADFVAMEVHVQQGDIDDAVAVGERARGGFEAVADAWGTSSVALHLAHGLRLAGRIEHAAALLEVGSEEAERAGIRNTLCGIHVDLARIALHRADGAATRRSVDRVRSLAEDLGNRMLIGMAEVVEAALQLDRGRRDEARRLLRSAIALFEEEGVPGGLAEGLSLCALDEVDRGDRGAARRHGQRALEVARSMHDRGLQAQALEVLALVAASGDEHTDAATALGRAASVRREGGRPASRTEQVVVDRAATLARRALGQERFDELVAAAGAAGTS